MDASPWNVVSAISVQSVSVFIQLIILTVYVTTFIKSLKSDRGKNVSIKMEILNITTLFVLFLQSVMWLLNYAGLLTRYANAHCDHIFFLCCLLYFYYIGLLFGIYAVRLHIVYDHTQFELSKRTKISMWFALILFVLWMTYTLFRQVFVNRVVVRVYFDHIDGHMCWGYLLSIDFVVVVFLLAVSVFSLVTMALFVKPLLILYSKTLNTGLDQMELLQLAAKYSILTLITMVTTAFACAGHVILHVPFIAGVNVLIQSFCIMLYEERFSNIYDCICWKVNEQIQKKSSQNHVIPPSVSRVRTSTHTADQMEVQIEI
eukprot:217962_1